MYSKILFHRYDENNVTMAVFNIAIKYPKICGTHGSEYPIQRASSTCVATNSNLFDFTILFDACKKNKK